MKRVAMWIGALALVLTMTASAQPSRQRGDRTKLTRSTAGTAGTRETREAPDTREVGSRDADAQAKLGEIQGRIPTLSGAQQQNVQSLQQDLKVLAGGAQSAEDEIRQLAGHLQGMAIQPPDPVLVQNLATDLQAAVGDSSLSPVEIAHLTQDVNAVLNSANLTQDDLAVLQDDVEAILAASGVGKAEIEAVLRDLEAIYAASQGPGKSGTGGERSRPRLRGGA